MRRAPPSLRAAVMVGLVLAPAGAASGATAIASGAAAITIAPPAEFADLAAPQQAVVDVYSGGVRLTDARVTFAPGYFRFADPEAVASAMPDIADRGALVAALSTPTLVTPDANGCRPGGATGRCTPIAPDVAAIAFDQSRYRVDLIVSPRVLTVRAAEARRFLPAPQTTLSALHSLAGTISGSGGRNPRYYLQDQALVSLGSGRVRALLSQASEGGFHADTLAVDLDRPGRRYTAGAFWLPGNDLIGRRRIAGGGIASQFDTRLDRQQFEGSPLVLFLDERAKVDVLVGDRLLSSRFYEAGSQAIDTAALPEGAYDVRLRVTGASGRVVEERRFFSRSRLLPPIGHDVFFAYAGAPIADRPAAAAAAAADSHDRGPVFQAAWARRIRPGMAVNLGVMGSGQRQWLDGGLTLIAPTAQVDGTLLVSTRGDIGAYGHVSSAGPGRLAYDLDARFVSAHGPAPARDDADTARYHGEPASARGYLQVSGAASYQLPDGGRLALTGSYRRTRGNSDYAFGPSLRLSLWRDRHATLGLNGNYTLTGRGRQGYLGLSLRIDRGRTAYGAEGGVQRLPGAVRNSTNAVGALSATARTDGLAGIDGQATGSLVRDGTTDYAMAQADMRGRRGEMMFNLTQPVGGAGRTQYGVSLHSNLVMRPGALALTGGTAGDAVMIAQVDDASPADRYDVLVDNATVATIRGAGSAVLTLPAYRAYDVRVRGRGAALTDYDSTARTVGLYPGTVARLRWHAETVTPVFGRLLLTGGRAAGDAEIMVGHEVAQTDGAGHFLIQIGAERRLTAHLPGGATCAAMIGEVTSPTGGYAAIGDVFCTPTTAGTMEFAAAAKTKGQAR